MSYGNIVLLALAAGASFIFGGLLIALVFYQIALAVRRSLVEEQSDRRAKFLRMILAVSVCLSWPVVLFYSIADHILDDADNDRQVFLEDLQNNINNMYTDTPDDAV